MYKQKDCSDFKTTTFTKIFPLKLGIASKHWFTNIKVLWKDPKHVCLCMCINILLPYYIKITNLKTVLTYKQIRVKQSPLNGLNIMWHMMWAVYLRFLRDNHWWARCGSWKLQVSPCPSPMPAAEGITVNTPHTVYRTQNTMLFFYPLHQKGLRVSISFEDLCQQSCHDSLKTISFAC